MILLMSLETLSRYVIERTMMMETIQGIHKKIEDIVSIETTIKAGSEQGICKSQHFQDSVVIFTDTFLGVLSGRLALKRILGVTVMIKCKL